MKIRKVGAELFHVDRPMDGQTDRLTDRRDGGNSRFSQFCEIALKLRSTKKRSLHSVA